MPVSAVPVLNASPSSYPLQALLQVGYFVMIAGIFIVVRVLLGKLGDVRTMIDEVLNQYHGERK